MASRSRARCWSARDTFEREFGVTPRSSWLPDSFGFTWALPTLMAAAGLPYFVTHKLSWSTTNRIPHDTFRWRGPDGSEVLAHFLCTPSLSPGEHTTYNGHLLPSITRGAWRRFQDRQLQDELLVAFGLGRWRRRTDHRHARSRSADQESAGLSARGDGQRPRVLRAAGAQPCRARRTCRSGTASCTSSTTAARIPARRARNCRNALAQRLYHAAELYAASCAGVARRGVSAAGARGRLEADPDQPVPRHPAGLGHLAGLSWTPKPDFLSAWRRSAQQVLESALRQIGGGDRPGRRRRWSSSIRSPFPSAGYVELPAGTAPDRLSLPFTANVRRSAVGLV